MDFSPKTVVSMGLGHRASDKNLTNIDATLQNLAATTDYWKVTSAKLDPTLEEARTAIGAIKKVAAGAELTLQSANQALIYVKPSLNKLPKAVDQLASTTAKAGDVLDRMKRGEGLLGAFASDNDVALDAKAFFKNLRQYGIFRYRDGVSKAQSQTKAKQEPLSGGRIR